MLPLLLLATGVSGAVCGAVELGRSRGIRGGREEGRPALVGCGAAGSAAAQQGHGGGGSVVPEPARMLGEQGERGEEKLS
jgi:hypothetical protein